MFLCYLKFIVVFYHSRLEMAHWEPSLHRADNVCRAGELPRTFLTLSCRQIRMQACPDDVLCFICLVRAKRLWALRTV